MFLKPVHDCKEIDLTKHGLIEASAGTGKTYMIENLVVRLLKENKDLSLEHILIVTFTEKATCELKLRIREKIESELNKTRGLKVANKLRDSLDIFDTASIFTIHGFCQTVLNSFAFENNALFKNELIDDTPVFDAALKEHMRKTWFEKYGKDLPAILKWSGLITKAQTMKFGRKVLAAARQTYRKNAGDVLLPDIGDKSFDQLQGRVKKLFSELQGLIKADKSFSNQFEKLNINARTRKNLIKTIIEPLEDYFSAAVDKNIDISGLQEMIARIQKVKSAGKKGIQCLVPDNWLKAGPNPDACPMLQNLIDVFEKTEKTLDDLKQKLVIETIHELQTQVRKLKAKNSWISFDDMINIVEKALYDDNAGGLLKMLRQKYKAAFVDEFQDTDPVQWKIFKKIFLDINGQGIEKDSNASLFLIGDPKQAVYSFRGADVFAYLEAKNKIADMAKQNRAGLYRLDTNWRSQPGLIKSFNRLFGRDKWFKPEKQADKFEICYQNAAWPDEKQKRVLLSSDMSGRCALNMVDLSSAKSSTSAKIKLAKFIAMEIRRLIDLGNIKLIKDSKENPLNFGNICILVRAKSESALIEDELSRLEIPYTYYKKPGLFQSDEAFYLSQVFQAILNPGSSEHVKKALLTPFFGFKAVDIYNYEQMPLLHPLKQMFFKWNKYALSRRTGILFQSLINDSGLMFREAGKISWDRTHTNYRQIFEYLEEIAFLKNMDFRQITSMLKACVKDKARADKDADIHQIETEEEKVKIMTMHVSKGLQFPVVFVAGGLTQKSVDSEEYRVYHEIVKKDGLYKATKIINFSTQDKNEKHLLEKADEDKRLYYVACTRAEHKLYLPYYPYEGKSRWVGPVSRLLSPVTADVFFENDDVVLWLKPDGQYFAEAGTGSDEQKTDTEIILEDEKDLFPHVTSYTHRKITLESFTSLHDQISPEYKPVYKEEEQKTDFNVVYEKTREDDETFASQIIDTELPDTTGDQIPGGTETGSMFHNILEHIDFKHAVETMDKSEEKIVSLINDSETGNIILKYMEMYGMDSCWTKDVCRIIGNTLLSPINVVDDGFTLGMLDKTDRLHELEFIYPFKLSGSNEEIIPDCKAENSFIRGSVDMVFRYNKKFYIADWKSNYIENGYDQDSMAVNMQSAGYDLQYKLYAVAVLRWLKQAMGIRFDPVENFGGVFYFYLRGMGNAEGDGIFYVSADKLGSLEEIECGMFK